ncbi:calcium-binding mitochondrial carrier SAL1-like isoform X2 [Musa acuminata AAA Group]|uniref:calcium-binding mitochondrial carrier SAL1-like isoform X2 n=1 Tax=Musa acuminata AAA Group TaxID=214697 RepID=UPI0031DD66B5
MACSHGCAKNDKSSSRYRWAPLDVQSHVPNKISHQKDASRARAKGNAQSETKSPIQQVRTSEFISAVAGIWDYVADPAVFYSDESLKYHNIHQKDNIICYVDRQRNHKPATAKSESFCYGPKSLSSSSSAVRSNFEELKWIKKQLLLPACNRYVGHSFISKHVWLSGFHPHVGNDKMSRSMTPTVKTKLYERINENSALEDLKDVTGHSSIGKGKKTPVQRSASQDKGNYVISECNDTSSDHSLNTVEKDLHIKGSHCSTYSLMPMTIRKEAVVGLRNYDSNLHLGYNFDFLTSTDRTCGQCQQAIRVVSSSLTEVSDVLSNPSDHNIHRNDKSFPRELLCEQQYTLNDSITVQDKLKKADGMVQKSAYCTLKRIISEKGLSGLYRGIAANIASSAPISAIYTFTYESVKGTLLPILPKEYHSFAHCIAGGCSSIATSFVFTPSERIKQQMQVGSQYQNCWNAFVGCLEKGGLPSLYAGWRAVLCRNIPHSIIKFYTYESLKQLSSKPEGGLSTLQTLLCGGLAGSTAALFTTPFDVVKTKLQTQAPGTLRKYNGVGHALQEIARQEGLQGLYRGLTPRLAMYVSQGAIFFASYEFLKAVFALEAPRLPAQVIHDKQRANNST